ncbi:MAG TPA: ribosomal-processing cysteine protease Prp [Bacillota bacterium]|nr:ribosomal-processing cysteine protease Prp [Bacillota bacterium]
MITIVVKRQPSGDVQSITIDGHAGFDDPGKDIVCAAVSGISFGMLNAVDRLLGVELPVQQGDSGFLHWELPELESEKHQRIQLLMDAMVASLRSVAIEYGKFVKVHDTKVNRRWI